ncbi:fatty-acid amide hydrolase 1-like isoform X2 [Ciona intestinalis]
MQGNKMSSGLIETYGIKSVKAACLGAAIICGSGVIVVHLYKLRKCNQLVKEKNKKEKLFIKQMLMELEDKDENEREKILSMTAQELVNAAKKGEIDPVVIIQSYIYKACYDTQTFNSVSGVIRDAEEFAKQLNVSQDSDSSSMKLFGLPVSLKECIGVKGMDSTIGYSSLINKPALEDSVIVKVLKSCGAVPFVKTNLVQGMLCFESSNPIFGETGNPKNVNYTPGGSSSGSGSLVGSGGSVLGFGTDIGGSIRNPAHFCGVCGLKPTMQRLSKIGLQGCLPGQSCLASCVGPLAQDVDTLVLAMQALSCPLMSQLDKNIPPLPFNDELFQSKLKLRIGYYTNDGYAEPVPAVQRAVLITKEILEKAGHTLVPFKVPRIEDAVRILSSALFADGGRTCMENLKNDLVDPANRYLYWRLSCPAFLRPIVKYIVGWGSPRIANDLMVYGGGDCSVYRLWKIQAETEKYKKEFFTQWRDLDLNAMICPPFPIAAAPIGSVEHTTALASYTTLFNLLNCPSGVIPVTKVSQADTDKLKDYKGNYGDKWDNHIKKVSENSTDMPIGVQFVGLPWMDEICLRLMKEVETQILLQ